MRQSLTLASHWGGERTEVGTLAGSTLAFKRGDNDFEEV